MNSDKKYTASSLYELEKSALGNEWWHLICHRSDLKETKSYISLKMFGGDLLVWRDGDEFVATDNLCPHRGAQIFTEISGNGPMFCPYHGWSYRNGKGNLPGCKQADPELVVPTKFHIEWCGDLLFVAKTPKMSLREQLAGLWDTVEGISHSMTDCHDINEYTYECNWKVAIENALEPYHVSLVHSSSLSKLKLSGHNEFHGHNSVYFSPVGSDKVRKGLEKLQSFYKPKYLYPGYCSVYIFPWSMISSTYSQGFSLQNFHASGEDQLTHFYSRQYGATLSDPKYASITAEVSASAAKFNRQVFLEDHDICKRVKETYPLREQKVFHPQEEKVVHFREQYKKVVLDK